jgi:tetratricopeptide (TPR) repeat protein
MSQIGSGVGAMPSVTETIDAYYQAVANEDQILASKILETLENETYRNEADWQSIHDFYTTQNFDARLEIVTKALIKSGRPISDKPHLTLAAILIKSGRTEEARSFLRGYLKNSQEVGLGKWELLTLLFDAGAYDDSLEVIQGCIRAGLTSFPYHIMEVRALSRLKKRAQARTKLRSLLPLLETTGFWAWFSEVALEIHEPNLAQEAVPRLIGMLEQGSTKVSQSVIRILVRTGHEAKVRDILESADPHAYSELSELVYVFETAVTRGVYKAARNFGEAILCRDKDHILSPKIKQLLNAPFFLMS